MKKWLFLGILGLMLGYTIYTTMVKNKEADEVEEAETVGKTNVDLKNEVKEEETKKGDPNEVGLNIGNIAPDFELKVHGGGTKKLSDFRGEPAMLNFWGTWCPPCQAEMPDMEKFYKDTKMPIVSVNLTRNESSKNNVPKFIKDYGLTFPILLDEKLEVSELYMVRVIPTTYFLDKEGRIQAKRLGPMNYEYMKDQYEQLK
ncbi:TlpA disulfide reductase family protein [Aciduricibacillus chroicocephali]|uniref:TlpA disulfide reductase family protein n=1 Tax=Aciduricibacillus chroicocephali TaxID=3054939 RepID=A0ABY9KU46_9BACI|nr:TlpA disulfide reductase family protein [Bacillaceae bacterium 44XB]